MKEPGRRPPDPFADPVAVALVETVAALGYDGATVAEILRRSGVGTEAFQARFAGKEDCVQRSFEAFIEDFLWKIATAYGSGEGWRGRLRAAAYATTDWIESHPDTARFGMVDVLAARNEMIRVRREELFEYCAGLIDEGRQEAAGPGAVPAGAALMAVGAVVQVVAVRMQRGGDLELGRLVPEMMYQAVRPYLGESVAQEELRIGPVALPDWDLVEAAGRRSDDRG